jgi:hypothetical protein
MVLVSKKFFLFIVILLILSFNFAQGNELDFGDSQNLLIDSDLKLNSNLFQNLNKIGIKGIGIRDISDIIDKFQNVSFKIINIDINTNSTKIPLNQKSTEPLFDESEIKLKNFFILNKQILASLNTKDIIQNIKNLIIFIISIFLVVLSVIAQILNFMLDFFKK